MSKIEVLTGGGVAIIDDSDPDGILCVKTITPDEIPALLAALLGQAGAKICYVEDGMCIDPVPSDGDWWMLSYASLPVPEDKTP